MVHKADDSGKKANRIRSRGRRWMSESSTKPLESVEKPMAQGSRLRGRRRSMTNFSRSMEPVEVQKPMSARPGYSNQVISIEEFKRFLEESKETSRNRTKAPMYTARRRQSLTIGDSSMDTWSKKSEPLFESSLRMLGGKRSSVEEKPVSWRTSFDIDVPREPMVAVEPLSPSPSPSLDDFVQKDEWESIDRILLDNSSVDASVACSTSDILHSDTVKAMRNNDRKQSKSELRRYKDAMLLNQSLSARKSTEKREAQYSRKSFRKSQRNEIHLFQLFKWSSKENVDKEKAAPRILNQRPRPLDSHLPQVMTKLPSDHSSMPGLQDFTGHTHDHCSVISDSTHGESSFAEEKGGDDKMTSVGSQNVSIQPSRRNDTPKWNEEILYSLATIVEDNHASFPNSASVMSRLASVKQQNLAQEGSPSPTSVAENSQLDELQSLASMALSTNQTLLVDEGNHNGSTRRRKKKNERSVQK
eukprot:scaffold3084_cov144-Cylindrotheca_fusiformis.AAC.67